MSKLEDDFRTVGKYLTEFDQGAPDRVEEAFQRIAEAMQEASGILIRARHICQALTIHDDSMEGKVISEIDTWRKNQGLER
jgi:hypothetical protein